MKQKCPYCGSQLHLYLTGGNITDAFCMKCNVNIPLDKIVFEDESIVCDEQGYCNEPIKSDKGCLPVAVTGFVVMFLLVVMSALMTGCKTLYVPVESVRTEYRDRLQHDSIYMKDSIYIRERGDTVFADRWHTKYVERLRVDSFCKTDSVPVPYPVEVIKEVEKKLSWWQSIKMDVGGIALGALLLILIYFVIRLVKKFKLKGWSGLFK